MSKTHCGCGEWLGQPCDRESETSDMIEIEWMPEQFRESHNAAHNAGVYPHNGAQRALVAVDCARMMRESDPDWTEIIRDPLGQVDD